MPLSGTLYMEGQGVDVALRVCICMCVVTARGEGRRRKPYSFHPAAQHLEWLPRREECEPEGPDLALIYTPLISVRLYKVSVNAKFSSKSASSWKWRRSDFL